MTKSGRWLKLLPDFQAVLFRFPAPIFASLLTFAHFNTVMIDNRVYDHWNETLAGCLAFLASGAAHLWAESRSWGRLNGSALAFAAGTIVAAFVWFDNITQTSTLYLAGALILLLMLAPHVKRGASQAALWLYNLRLGLAILLAGLVAVIAGFGLSAVAAGLDFLLDIKVPNSFYERIWSLSLIVIGPVYGLLLMLRELDDEINIEAHGGSLLERGTSVLINYIMVPLVVVYALILHAYALKIAVSANLPKGEIGTIVSLFAVGGTVTWLLSWPWRNSGTGLMKLFMRGWFWLLPVPVVLLIIAIWRRISDYGVTPDRYGIVLVAAWAAIVFVYLLLRRRAADMRVILGAIAVLLLVGAAGPFGALGLTGSSQFARLKQFLETNGVLINGKLAQPLPTLDRTIADNARTMVASIVDARASKKLERWIGTPPEALGSNDRWAQIDSIQKRLGIAWEQTLASDFSFDARSIFEITTQKPGRLIGQFSLTQSTSASSSQPDSVVAVLDKTTLTISKRGGVIQIPSAQILQRIKAHMPPGSSNSRPLQFEAASGTTLIITYAAGSFGAASLRSIGFWLLIEQ
jgi:Domain of unknown function (DUF4153)